MLAARLFGSQDLRIQTESEPQPAPGESLIKVTAVGLCGSDLLWLEEGEIGDAILEHPLVLGHEFGGVVVENAPGKPGSRQMPPGTRVAVDPAVPCQDCEFCLKGHPNLCERLLFAGHGQFDGGLRQLVSWPDRCLYRVPDEINDEEAALLEPLGVAIHAVDLGKVRPGVDVGVFGCGPIGLLIVQAARAAGASRIFATDEHQHRLQLALELGATRVFQVDGGEEAARVTAANGQRGVEVAFEAAGENPAVEAAVESALPGGRVVLVGIPADNKTTFNAATARRKGLSILLCRRMKHTYPRAMRLVTTGQVNLRALVSHRFPLEQSEEAFRVALQRSGNKVIVNP
ncbi:MAG: zinc-dependent alcohol dehydrogenase [Anaerolineales bacterium]